MWRRGIDVCVALAVGAAGGACAHVAVRWSEPPGVAAEVAAAVLERGSTSAESAVWRIEVDACGSRRQASVTVLWLPGRGALGVTNAHVVDGAGSVVVRSPHGVEGAARVVGTVPGRDLAVVSFADAASLAAHAEQQAAPHGPPAEVGDEVAVVGHPDGEARRELTRVRAVELRSARGATSPVLVLDGGAAPGSSGGGVFDAEGRVVGVVAARDPLTGSAVAYPVAEALAEPTGPLARC